MDQAEKSRKLIVRLMKLKPFIVALSIWLVAGAGLSQTVTVLHVFSFDHSNGTADTNSDGTTVAASLLVTNNEVYGTTSSGGINGNGTIFSMDVNGSNFMVLHTFSMESGSPSTNDDGAAVDCGLLISGSTLYGAAQYGGRGGWGIIFSLSTNGTNFTVLHAFTNQPDGAWPEGNLLLAGGTLYGTTDAGGSGLGVGCGTVFSVSTNGTNFKVLHAFTNSPDGLNPVTGLALFNGRLYGTTRLGGTNGYGSVFSINTNGTTYTRLHSFTNNAGGYYPESDLVILSNKLYGTAFGGGTNNNGVVFTMGTNGANYATLHLFTNTPDGSGPFGVLAVSGDTLYGMTVNGGTNGTGAIFTINTNGNYEIVLHSYTYLFDGFFPIGGPVLAGHTLYASSSQGGGGVGTIIGLDLTEPQVVISNLVVNLDGSVKMSFTGPIGSTCLVQAATNLSPPVVWLNVSTNFTGYNGAWQYTDTVAPHSLTRFYRTSTP